MPRCVTVRSIQGLSVVILKKDFRPRDDSAVNIECIPAQFANFHLILLAASLVYIHQAAAAPT